jgi:hypothetical protein
VTKTDYYCSLLEAAQQERTATAAQLAEHLAEPSTERSKGPADSRQRITRGRGPTSKHRLQTGGSSSATDAAAAAVVEGTRPGIAGPQHASITAAEACCDWSDAALCEAGASPTAHTPNDAAALKDACAEPPAHLSNDAASERAQLSAAATVAGLDLDPDMAQATAAASAAGYPDQEAHEAHGSAWQQQRTRWRRRRPDGDPAGPEQPSGRPAANGSLPSAPRAMQQPTHPQAWALRPAASAAGPAGASTAQPAAAPMPVTRPQHTPAQQQGSRQAMAAQPTAGGVSPSVNGAAATAAAPMAAGASVWPLPDAAAAPSWQEVSRLSRCTLQYCCV